MNASKESFAAEIALMDDEALLDAAVASLHAAYEPGRRDRWHVIRAELKKRTMGGRFAKRLAAERSAASSPATTSRQGESLPDDGTVSARLHAAYPKPRATLRLPTGAAAVTNGYYQLEETERSRRDEAMKRHPTEVTLWCRGLTLFVAGIEGTFENHQMADAAKGEALLLQCDLIGLSLTSSKAALDLLLVGYYSTAFATIRHMLETFLICGSLDAEPSWAFRWRTAPEGEQIEKPVVKDFYRKASEQFPDLKGWWDNAYELWKEMNTGAHPSGEGLYPLLGNALDQRILGPVYVEQRALMGFGSGLFAVCSRLAFLGQIKHFPQEWHDRNTTLQADVDRWRQQMSQQRSR